MNVILKKCLVVFLSLSSSSAIYSQYSENSSSKERKINLNLYGSYAFKGHFESYSYDYSLYYQGQLVGNFLWAGGVEYKFGKNTFAELSYLSDKTSAPVQYFDNDKNYIYSSEANLKMNYLLAGVNLNLKLSSIIDGFGGVMVGACFINTEDQNLNQSKNLTNFAYGIKGGIILWVTNRFGVKFQIQLLAIPQSIHDNFYFSDKIYPDGYKVYSSIYQSTLGGGLVFKL